MVAARARATAQIAIPHDGFEFILKVKVLERSRAVRGVSYFADSPALAIDKKGATPVPLAIQTPGPV